MYNSTGLAVGLAIGIPAFLVIIVITIFWYRQKLNYKRDIKQHSDIDDYDEANDLDLDNMVESPKVKNTEHYLNNDSGLQIDDHNEASPDGVIIRNGSYSVRKDSKIMGLRMISQSHSKLNSNTLKNNNDQTSTYKTYYASMIPVLPDSTVENGLASSAGSEDKGIDQPRTPIKGGNLGRNSTQSSIGLYKMLQDDSPMYPKSRVTSIAPAGSASNIHSLNESSTKNISSRLHSSKIFDSSSSISQAEDKKLRSPQMHDDYASPFDTPPSKMALDLTEDFSTDDVKSNSNGVFENSFHPSEEYDKDNQQIIENSPVRQHIHKRMNSAESKIMLDDDTAEESYNMKRREWLGMYKNR